MKRRECGFVSPPTTDNDKREIELFTAYLERRANHPKEPPMRSYASIYGVCGEVVFDSGEDGGTRG
jgi:hypothetical protein